MRYPIYAVLLLISKIVVFVTAWIIAIIPAIFKLKELPWPFSLAHSHDDDLYGSKTTGESIPKSVFGRWKRITWWIMRNPAYGFAAHVLGFPATAVVRTLDTGKSIEKGLMTTFLLNDGSTRWGYRQDLYWAFGFYVKIQLGWYWKERAGYHMLKIQCNPFKRPE